MQLHRALGVLRHWPLEAASSEPSVNVRAREPTSLTSDWEFGPWWSGRCRRAVVFAR
jgi:hypothetical protein